MVSDFLDHFLDLLAASLSGLPSRREKLHEIPLDEMIKSSTIVVVGKVVRMERYHPPKTQQNPSSMRWQ
jgi:hypothetical protein